jgi:hypothetical protein
MSTADMSAVDTSTLAGWQQAIAADGFAILPAVYPGAEAESLALEMTSVLDQQQPAASLRSRAGTLVAARNVLDACPMVADVWRRAPLVALLGAVLGDQFGLVRALFFDKPPERTWALAWHKDLTIAVRDNALPSTSFARPTTKAGVPHVEAPLELLEQMLTLRIHLDEVTDENGPLRVMPGSHRSGKQVEATDRPAQDILAAAGDVLAMRPLVSHASGPSQPGCARHRRVLHLEFAGQAHLPDGYAWREFIG